MRKEGGGGVKAKKVIKAREGIEAKEVIKVKGG